MNFKAYQEHLTYLLDLVEKGIVHSTEQTARQFSCNEKTVRSMINMLRVYGNEIDYCRKSKKYILKR